MFCGYIFYINPSHYCSRGAMVARNFPKVKAAGSSPAVSFYSNTSSSYSFLPDS